MRATIFTLPIVISVLWFWVAMAQDSNRSTKTVLGTVTNGLRLHLEVESDGALGSRSNPIVNPIGKYTLNIMVTNVTEEYKGIYHLPRAEQQFALTLADAAGRAVKRTEAGERIGRPFVAKGPVLETFRGPGAHGMMLGPRSYGYALSITPDEYFEIFEPGKYTLQLELRLVKVGGGSGIVLGNQSLPCKVEMEFNAEELLKLANARKIRKEMEKPEQR